ncbi:flagellar hook-length control protein FliK [Arcobacter sp. LA11]|uniref:flagellar hook-length control protein FliK n=1 Tax=Arcobacter sp. LA11 TaxID=1898176 RepID=UPI000933ECBC|nr:flagellar hook-length control protein FliK [Arcobacter sp. LA11]
MTKEVDFLSLGKAAEVKIDSKTNTKLEKKEGLSLFDSLMVNNQKKETSKEKVETKAKTDKNPEKELTGISKESNEKKLSDVDTKVEKKESINLEANSKKSDKSEIKEEKKDITSNDKKTSLENETKSDKTSSSTSLLDRMIIEAKKNIKTLDNEKGNLHSKKEAEVKEANVVDNKKESNEKSTKNESLLDKMINQSKEIISENSSKNDLKDNDSKNKKNTEKETVSNPQISKIEKNIKEESSVKILGKEDKNEISKEEISIKIDSTVESKDDSKKIKKDMPDSKNIESKTENKIEKTILETKTDVQDIKIEKNVNTDEKILKKEDNTKTEIKNNESGLDKDTIKSSIETTAVEKKEIVNIDTKDVKDTKKVEIKEPVDVKDTKKVDITSKEDIKIEKPIINANQEKIATKNSIDTPTKNLSNLDSEAIVKDEQRVNIDKKDLLKENLKENNSSNNKVLMDKLVDNAKNSMLSSKETVSNQPLQEQTSNLKSNDVVTNIFLSNQKNSIYNQMLSSKKEGTQIVKEGKSLDDVKKGAEILDLGLKKTSVEIESVNKNIKIDDKFDNDALLDKLAFRKMTNRIDSTNVSANIVSSTTSQSAETMEHVSNLNVNPSLALSIQNRIIGAQQHMSSMMSDVARNMYQNYKPPVTAFRINLFPSQLGHIAILMKNDKDNGISISMNMSNSNTLDSFVENQNVLREALNRNFNNNQTTFELDFNLQDQSSNSNQSNHNSENKENKENHSSNEILESITQNQDIGEDLNYL